MLEKGYYLGQFIRFISSRSESMDKFDSLLFRSEDGFQTKVYLNNMYATRPNWLKFHHNRTAPALAWAHDFFNKHRQDPATATALGRKKTFKNVNVRRSIKRLAEAPHLPVEMWLEIQKHLKDRVAMSP